MNVIFKILFLLIALEVVAVTFFVYRKRRLVKNDKKTSLPRLSKLAGLTIYKLAGLIKKHWITPVCIVSVCIALFALIYPTIWFVYIKYIIYLFTIGRISYIYLFILLPILWLIYKKEKLSPLSVLGISFFSILLILLLLIFYPHTLHLQYWSFIWPFLGMPFLYFTVFLFMGLLKKKITYWWLILLICNIALSAAGVIKSAKFIDVALYNSNYIRFDNLTNIRSESECITLKGKKVKDNDGGQCWERYSWVHGLCVKSEGVSCIGPIGRAFQ